MSWEGIRLMVDVIAEHKGVPFTLEGCEISEGERSKRVMHDWRMSVIRWLILQGGTDKGRFEAWSNERLMSKLYRQMESLDTDI